MSSEPRELDKKIQDLAKLGQKIVDAIQKESKIESEKAKEEFNYIIKEAEKEQKQRRDKLELERENRKEEFRKKWQRY